MTTKVTPWMKWGCLAPLAVVAVLAVSAYVFLRIQDSPRNVLKQALHLQTLPPSIKGLRMGSDVWTDEVRGFCFEIAPNDFPLLLRGRQFELRDMGTTYEAKTVHVKPAVSFTARWCYVWTTNGANCTIDTTDAKNRVAVIFAAD